MEAVVTGTSGFVGRVLVARLPRAHRVSLAAPDWRSKLGSLPLSGRVVLHLAARVHMSGAPEDLWNEDNVAKTEALALAAAHAGAARFVFMSTLKVHGEESSEVPFRPGDALKPQDGYARSKALAEESLARISRESGLAVTIVRAPLVFGRDAKANLRAAVRLARSGVPLPFASIRNRRSWIHVEDLCELLLACARDPSPANATFIATHPEPFSTPRLFGGLRARMASGARLFPAPPGLLESMAALAGKRDAMRRLTRSLEGDPGDAMARLGWSPRMSFEQALDDLVQDRRA